MPPSRVSWFRLGVFLCSPQLRALDYVTDAASFSDYPQVEEGTALWCQRFEGERNSLGHTQFDSSCSLLVRSLLFVMLFVLLKVTVYHPSPTPTGEGSIAHASVGWPGVAGILTGFSDAQIGISEIGVSFPDDSFGQVQLIRIRILIVFVPEELVNFPVPLL
jgi:hypothetical protein